MTDSLTVEITSFKLKPGVDDAAFLRAAEAMASDLQAVPGFVRRELLHGDEGLWIDVVHWRSLSEALAAMDFVMTKPSTGPFMAALDESSIAMQHLQQVMVDEGSTAGTVEIVFLRLQPDADEDPFIRAAGATTSDLQSMAGYSSRELLRSEDGQWVDIVHWTARDQALAAADQFPALPSAQAFGSLMDGESIRVMHLERVL
jgi:heme-degrading monooxygenase HmoA